MLDSHSRTPESTGYNTLFCNSGNSEAYATPQNERYEAIMQCTGKHDQTHMRHALSKNSSICKGNVGGTIIINDEDVERLASEKQSFEVEISCLKSAPSICESDCQSRGNSRINILEWIKLNQIDTGAYS